LTREQYEALYDIREKYGDSIYNWSDAGNDADTIKLIEQTKKDMQAQIASTLGADKAQELERAQDYSFQQLAHLAKRNNLPADTASKIYDIKQAAEQATQELRANNDLTPEQRQAALAQIGSETQQSVKSALGDKLYKRYLNAGGWWLNNISPARMHQN
jgi:Mg2+ and Co2+ transporter CorA